MNPSILCMLFSSLLFYSSVLCAKTLVITHPQSVWDDNSSAGPETRRLLESSDFQSKFVLLSMAREHGFKMSSKDLLESHISTLTFDPGGLDFDVVSSRSGRFDWEGNDNHVVLGGGFLSACLSETLEGIIAKSQDNSRITIAMKAVYTSAYNTNNYTIETLWDNYLSVGKSNAVMKELLYKKIHRTIRRTFHLLEQQKGLNPDSFKLNHYLVDLTFFGETIEVFDSTKDLAYPNYDIPIDGDKRKVTIDFMK